MSNIDANKINLFKNVSRDVHEKDEMFRVLRHMNEEPGFAFHNYFYGGGYVAEKLRDYLSEKFDNLNDVSILDFACGHGRILRYLKLIFKDVTGSDLEQSMVDFVKDTLGANSFISNIELKDILFPNRRFDVIFSYSLFTHLNLEIWEMWFRGLFERVESGGFLIITTRSPEFARKKGALPEDFDVCMFVEKNETQGRLDSAYYGQTTIAPIYVQEVASRIDNISYENFFPGGQFDLHQDVHVFRKL